MIVLSGGFNNTGAPKSEQQLMMTGHTSHLLFLECSLGHYDCTTTADHNKYQNKGLSALSAMSECIQREGWMTNANHMQHKP